MLKRISPTRLQEVDARRVCLIKPSALGDVVQTLPLLPVLRERFPRASLSWLISEPLAGLLEGHPCLDRILRFERRAGYGHWLGLLRTLRRERFDLVFDLQGLLRTGIMAAATGAPLRVGLETAREGARFACHCTLPDSGLLVPAHRRYWRVAEAVGLGDRVPQTHVALGDRDREFAARQLAALPGPVLALHPGAQWSTKRWPPGKLAAVAAKAARRFSFSVVIVGSPDERRLAGQCADVLRQVVPGAPVRNLAGETTLKQLAALLSGVDVLLANDSGPMHLAAGLGTPVVAVFTCTDPERSGPPGDRHALVSTRLPCGGSYRKRCPHPGSGHLACLEELSADRVWTALARLVERRPMRGDAA